MFSSLKGKASREILVFVSSPADRQPERAAARKVIAAVNARLNTQGQRRRLREVMWEDLPPGDAADGDFQALISKLLERFNRNNFGIYLGFVGAHLGTATPRYESGTVEEFEESLARHRKTGSPEQVLFYFIEPDAGDSAAVSAFRVKLGQRGYLYHSVAAGEFDARVEAALFTLVVHWDDWAPWLRRTIRRAALPLVLLLVLLLPVLLGAIALMRLSDSSTPHYESSVDNFKYGSIGSEWMPYWIWRILPSLYPNEFQGRQDYSAFGFIYETDAHGRQRDLPIGISLRKVSGVDMVWVNCATCHTGTWRESPNAPARIVAAMPANNLNFYRFIRMIQVAATDERLAPDSLLATIEQAGARLDPIDRAIWYFIIQPRFRETLLKLLRLQPLFERQSPWGVGRVDAFNFYKLMQLGMRRDELAIEDGVGVADFPAVFNQRPREGMDLQWDGSNKSLAERNLWDAISAGATIDRVDHSAIERVAAWLGNLKPPQSPHRPDGRAIARGQVIYHDACASCDGWQGENGYVFQGDRLGRVESIANVGTDRSRLDSHTDWLQKRQLATASGMMFQFRYFRKTDGYANMPLDGLWLRGPYLHNGSVPTLADLLKRPEDRPKTFLRGLDVVDSINGGFQSPPCNPETTTPPEACFDTSKPGNGSGGHEYGVSLTASEKADLLAYLLTF